MEFRAIEQEIALAQMIYVPLWIEDREILIEKIEIIKNSFLGEEVLENLYLCVLHNKLPKQHLRMYIDYLYYLDNSIPEGFGVEIKEIEEIIDILSNYLTMGNSN